MKENNVLTSVTIEFANTENHLETEALHRELLSLPARDYLDLYYMMKANVEHEYLYIDGPTVPTKIKGIKQWEL